MIRINAKLDENEVLVKAEVIYISEYIVVIGAANMDILGISKNPLIKKDSNPGNISYCPGGVGRNIAENLARLEAKVKFIGSVGNDVFGDAIISHCKEACIDTDSLYISEKGTTDSYIAIIDSDRDMSVAVSDMSLLEEMPIEHLIENSAVINNAKIIVIDACLSKKHIEYILTNFGSKKIFIDPVSIGKSKKIKNNIGRFFGLKCNKYEAEFLSDISIENVKDCEKAADILFNKGLKEIFISLGENGVYYKNESGHGHFATKPVTPVNTTGAGDSFMAGVVYSSFCEKSVYEAVRFASAMALITLNSNDTVSKYVTYKDVIKELEKLI